MHLSESDTFSQFYEKRRVTILITDSGLGGISICAEMAGELMRLHMFEKVSLIYFNAWPEQDRGYNRLSNTAERIQVFDSALKGMMQFKPDFILIACNTLSVLYPRTQFSQHVNIPVIDIVGFGVDMMTNALQTSPQSQVVILGTVTTIESHVHQENLIQNGIQADQIVLQPCDQLATEIEKDPAGQIVSDMIDTFMCQAGQKMDPACDNVYAALCCTHFAYCQDLIQDALADVTKKPVKILNPNRQMARYLLTNCRDTRFSRTATDIQVVSKIIWEEKKIKSISSLIQPVSPETANALKNYKQVSNLFA